MKKIITIIYISAITMSFVYGGETSNKQTKNSSDNTAVTVSNSNRQLRTKRFCARNNKEYQYGRNARRNNNNNNNNNNGNRCWNNGRGRVEGKRCCYYSNSNISQKGNCMPCMNSRPCMNSINN